MLSVTAKNLGECIAAQSRRMSSSMGPRITAKAERYQSMWGGEMGPDKAFAATEADLWRKLTLLAVPVACAAGEKPSKPSSVSDFPIVSTRGDYRSAESCCAGIFDLLSHMMHHHEAERIAAPYLRIRNKPFPW